MFDQDKINELYPEAIMIPAQKINKGTETILKEACGDEKHFGQLKKDGFFYEFEKTKNHEYLFGRSISKKTGLLTEKISNVPHIQKALSVLPAGTILVGEIYYQGGSSKDTTKIMGCLPEKAIARQQGEYGLIHYYIHDILMYDNLDFVINKVTNWDRYRILEKIFHKYDLDKYDFLELAESWEDDLYSRIGNALSAGEEGMVIKAKDGIYEPDKRPMTMIKAKKVDFADVIIIGFEEPTARYYGKEIQNWEYWVGTDDHECRLPIKSYYGDPCATPVTKPYYYNWHNSRIQIGVYDKDKNIVNIGTIHSGISDEMKKDMSENPQNYLNKVCAIQMMEVDKQEKTIRHGFFKFMRNDKNIEDCTVEEIFGQNDSMLF